MRDRYVRYMERLTGGVVVLVLGLSFGFVGLSIGAEQLVVETRGEWFRMDIVDGQRFLIGQVAGVLGISLAVIGAMVIKRTMRWYHSLAQLSGVADHFILVGLAVTVADAIRQAENGSDQL